MLLFLVAALALGESRLSPPLPVSAEDLYKLGVDAGIFTPPVPAKTTPARVAPVVTIPGGATITLAANTRYRLGPVKTPQGSRVQLSTPALTITAERLLIVSGQTTLDVRVSGELLSVCSTTTGP
jgi:hypothetical protein